MGIPKEYFKDARMKVTEEVIIANDPIEVNEHIFRGGERLEELRFPVNAISRMSKDHLDRLKYQMERLIDTERNYYEVTGINRFKIKSFEWYEDKKTLDYVFKINYYEEGDENADKRPIISSRS